MFPKDQIRAALQKAALGDHEELGRWIYRGLDAGMPGAEIDSIILEARAEVPPIFFCNHHAWAKTYNELKNAIRAGDDPMPLAIEIVEMAEHHHAQAIWEPADIIERGRNDVDNECYAKAGIAILATSAGSLGTPETMLSVLASGTLVSKPRQRIGNSGKPFATAQARIPSDGEASVLLSIIAFRDTAMQALLALDQGDAVALVGRGKLTCWQTNGGERHGLSVVAEQVLSVYQLEKRRSASTRAKVDADVPAQASKPDRAATAPDSGLVGDMTDDLPWPT